MLDHLVLAELPEVDRRRGHPRRDAGRARGHDDWEVLGRERIERAAQDESLLPVSADLVDVVGQHRDSLAPVEPAPERVPLACRAQVCVDLPLERLASLGDEVDLGLAAQRDQNRHDPDSRKQSGEADQGRGLPRPRLADNDMNVAAALRQDARDNLVVEIASRDGLERILARDELAFR